MKLKRRSPDDPVRKEAEAFTKAIQNLFVETCKALYIDRIVEWANP